jgi:hypothetical protein
VQFLAFNFVPYELQGIEDAESIRRKDRANYFNNSGIVHAISLRPAWQAGESLRTARAVKLRAIGGLGVFDKTDAAREVDKCGDNERAPCASRSLRG